MKYDFPHINHIDDVRPVIADKDEFIEAVKEGYTVINYVVVGPDTFPPVIEPDHAMLRECRGLIFDENGYIMSRRFHKFFNVNEREETQIQNIDISQPHVILEKLDGSMVTPIETEHGIRWATKMGVTETSMKAEEFVAEHPQYIEFARRCFNTDVTPIFEWVSRKNRIVLDYPEDNLVLLAIRMNQTGQYIPYPVMQFVVSTLKIPCVKEYTGTMESMHHLVDKTRGEEDIEGYVIRFDDGHMVKIKSEWYVNLHRVKEAVSQERNLVRLILDQTIDDYIGFADADTIMAIEKFTRDFHDTVRDVSYSWADNYYHSYKDLTRKDFALNEESDCNPIFKKIMFNLWDDSAWTIVHVIGEIEKVIYNSLGTNKKYFEVKKQLLPDLVDWEQYINP